MTALQFFTEYLNDEVFTKMIHLEEDIYDKIQIKLNEALEMEKQQMAKGDEFETFKQDDVEKLAEEYTNKRNYLTEEKQGFIDGYNHAKETLYTEEQVIEIVEKSRATGLTAEYIMLSLKQPKQ
jgi:hypothetical protein